MKGQIWSIDFAASLTIFVLVLSSLFMVWNFLSVQAQEQKALEKIELLALEVSDSILRTPGIPEDWNSSNVDIIGLSYSDHIIDPSKLINLNSTPYDQARLLMTMGYDFYLKIEDLNGTVYLEKGYIDQNRTVVPVERYANYNDRIVKVRMVLWA